MFHVVLYMVIDVLGISVQIRMLVDVPLLSMSNTLFDWNALAFLGKSLMRLDAPMEYKHVIFLEVSFLC